MTPSSLSKPLMARKITELEVIEENRINPSAATLSTQEQAHASESGGA